MLRVTPLGAGQDVGRSCILLSFFGKNILLDCGMHMGFEDARRFPDFTYISQSQNYNEIIDAVIITHFHLDHCGALPHFTEICGYDGPIYMTHPTRAICPILLEDFRKIAVERKGETSFFSSQNIRDCMAKVVAMQLKQKVMVDDELELTAFYAGHVLGAAMFQIRVGEHSVVYTGDYNMTPDRHLGSAWIDRIRPDLLITESTYCTYVRDSKRVREKDFLARVHATVEKGGKVLIPVFALGRVQELCILIETYWERMNLKVPVYFTAGLAAKANDYYRLFINWTNEKIKNSFVERNMFDFQHIKAFDSAFANNPGPMVLFATPGMLHAGTSLEIFKKWAGNPLNMVLIPGYCSVGTVGAKLLAGRHKNQRIEVDKKTFLEVNCSVEYLSFSAHADAVGIEELIRMCEPRNVMLVHGEKQRISEFKRKVVKDFGIPCFDPPNGTCVTLHLPRLISVEVNTNILKDHNAVAASKQEKESEKKKLKVRESQQVEGTLSFDKALNIARLRSDKDATQQQQVTELNYELTLKDDQCSHVFDKVRDLVGGEGDSLAIVGTKELHIRSLLVVLLDSKTIRLTWNEKEEIIAKKIIAFFE